MSQDETVASTLVNTAHLLLRGLIPAFVGCSIGIVDGYDDNVDGDVVAVDANDDDNHKGGGGGGGGGRGGECLGGSGGGPASPGPGARGQLAVSGPVS